VGVQTQSYLQVRSGPAEGTHLTKCPASATTADVGKQTFRPVALVPTQPLLLDTTMYSDSVDLTCLRSSETCLFFSLFLFFGGTVDGIQDHVLLRQLLCLLKSHLQTFCALDIFYIQSPVFLEWVFSVILIPTYPMKLGNLWFATMPAWCVGMCYQHINGIIFPFNLFFVCPPSINTNFLSFVVSAWLSKTLLIIVDSAMHYCKSVG
jgi:hypothetical protein